MENIESSPQNDMYAPNRLFEQNSGVNSSQNAQASGSRSGQSRNDGHLMPPPAVPPSASHFHLAQNVPGFSPFISPSKEGEVPMEFSPVMKIHAEKGILKDISRSPSTPTSLFKSLSTKTTPESKNAQACSSEMQPAEVFRSPGSPSSEFKAMLDAIDVQESPSASNDDIFGPNYGSEISSLDNRYFQKRKKKLGLFSVEKMFLVFVGIKNFLRRQEKPNLRRCRSLEMRKRLFDLSNTPPNAFKPVFKRPACVEGGDQNYTKLAKRPKDLKLWGIKEATTSPLVKEQHEAKGSQDKLCNPGEVLDHERIKVAVDALQSPDVIGDCSREHCLPVITGKHNDLKNISHETMAHLLNHGYKDKFNKLTVIDCRYPYEYEGGHIKGAINLYTEDDIDLFLKKEVLEAIGTKSKTHILIFHCEFSSQRGPGLLRHLRKLDRQMNFHQYPVLTFPEVYVLHLGYKEFFHNHPHLCVPSAYIPMADESYINDLKHFRAKAKSWTAGERSGSFKR